MAGSWRYVAAPKRHNMSQTDRGQWAEKKRIEALTTYMACGSWVQTAAQCNIPLETLRSWGKKDWWKEKVKDIQSEDYDKLDSRLSKALDKALDQVMDRIENGDAIYDPRTGKIRQIPTKLRDLNHAFNSLMDKRQLIRKQPTKIIEQTSTAASLQNLAEQFASFVNGRVKQETFNTLVDKVIEGETVQQNEDGSWEVKE